MTPNIYTESDIQSLAVVSLGGAWQEVSEISLVGYAQQGGPYE